MVDLPAAAVPPARLTLATPVRRRALLAGIGGLAVAAAIVPRFRTQGHLPAGIVVAGVDVGGLRADEALDALRGRLAAFERAPLTLRHGERAWTPTAADLGLVIDYAATIDGARQAGGAGGWQDRFRRTIAPDRVRTTVPLAVRIDEERMRRYLDGIDRVVAIPPSDARLVVAGSVVIEEGAAGSAIDRAAASAAIAAAIETLREVEVVLPVVPVPARVHAADLASAGRAAAVLVGAPVELLLRDRRWRVERADLLAALVLPDDPTTVPARLDPNRLTTVAASIAAQIDHPPVNATLGWDGGLTVIDPGYSGATVVVEMLAAAIAAAATTPARVAEVPVAYQPAAVRSDNLGDLGISTRLAVGTSSFAGSSAARATNVAVAAGHAGPAPIPPHGTFSFNETIGPITLANGYVEGKIILGDWFASDLGGGVCQVSTTVFRAALRAGLPFLEWHPHTFRLAFYEYEGWPPGMDAAIYQADDAESETLDLKFTNPTDAWLLLQTRVEGELVATEVFGPATGYEVRLGGPEFGEPMEPPPPIKRHAPELPLGTREVARTAQPGVTVRVTRTVLAEGEVLREDAFVSAYRPQPEVILVGDGGTAP